MKKGSGLDWIVQCFMSPPTQYGRQFLQVKRPNQQYQSTEGETTKTTKYTYTQTLIYTKKDIHKISTSPLVYTNMG